MKKNMLAVLILVVCIVNLTLVGYTVFTVVPNAQRTDELITKIMQIIDLELESPLPTDINNTYSIEDVEKYSLEEITTNLRTGADGKQHFAKITASLTINKTHEDYERLNPSVDKMKPDIQSIIMSNFQKYTSDELGDVDIQATVKQNILTDIQTLFNSRFIVDCTVTYLIS
ncbi:MAG: flagellar basal body-associated FliL family protein [Lachnospiraceae bacterium]|nr:flagellar basal body-associated FliL family protein [Lachnospiraceae bacterium]